MRREGEKIFFAEILLLSDTAVVFGRARSTRYTVAIRPGESIIVLRSCNRFDGKASIVRQKGTPTPTLGGYLDIGRI